MSMASKKTYLLAPNFDYAPDGAIALGNIIVNPFEPHRPLSSLDTSKRPEIVSKPDYDYLINRSSDQEISLGLWAQFLETIGVNIGSRYGRGTNTEYKMQSLETIMFKTEPSEEIIAERLNEPLIRNVMQYNSAFHRPVYMITGLKVAKGLEVAVSRDSVKEGNLSATVPTLEGVSLGANVGVSRGRGQTDSFRVGADVVFAYQLLRIGLKGWKKNLVLDEFKHKAGFLGQDSGEEEEEVLEPDVGTATAEDFSGVVEGEGQLHQIEIGGGDQGCICVSLSIY